MPSHPLSPHIPGSSGTLNEIAGIRVGHVSDREAATGITVLLCEGGAVCGLDIRGGASGVRNPTVATPGHLVEKVHAVFFSGGSGYGLDAGAGVMRFLEQRGVGFPVRGGRVPIVTGAILLDLGVWNARRRPGPAMAYRACRRATTREAIPEGSVGAGTGATVGKLFGLPRATKGGLGTALLGLGRLKVGALAVVNAFGDVRDPTRGVLVAGARDARRGHRLVGSEQAIRRGIPHSPPEGDSTTLGLVVTNARMGRESANRLASSAQAALARCLSPAHSLYDGDLVYALATGRVAADPLVVESLAVEALARAILRGVMTAQGLARIPAWRDLERHRVQRDSES